MNDSLNIEINSNKLEYKVKQILHPTFHSSGVMILQIQPTININRNLKLILGVTIANNPLRIMASFKRVIEDKELVKDNIWVSAETPL